MNELRGSRDIDYLGHMLDALRLARSYTEDQKKEHFLEDRKTQQAVILNILIIGEAATKLANEHPELVSEHPAFPWKQIRGMRNRMAHGYFEINLDIVWETLQQSLPELEQQILHLMPQVKKWAANSSRTMFHALPLYPFSFLSAFVVNPPCPSSKSTTSPKNTAWAPCRASSRPCLTPAPA